MKKDKVSFIWILCQVELIYIEFPHLHSPSSIASEVTSCNSRCQRSLLLVLLASATVATGSGAASESTGNSV
jgi:hypothetical protein